MVETLTAVQTDEDESGVSLVEETYLKPLKVRISPLDSPDSPVIKYFVGMRNQSRKVRGNGGTNLRFEAT